ncbi:MAG: M48 family metallopeptidase [Bacteroidales bacterium]|nr:M48 family metallopeptidase [Bacteroides sp.]MCM1197380.1 M48 family metallopeptidase [Clostridium sp.]MCM1503432.1 M48 family metallopeptidase [Bacteroidales bacterium]
MQEKVYKDPEIGDIRLRKSMRSRNVSIRVSLSRGVVVTVPYPVSYEAGMKFFMSRREWVLATIERQNSVARNVISLTAGQTEELRRKAQEWLPVRLSLLAGIYGFSYVSVSVKNNRTNWGSCSTRSNINLNLKLMAIPEPLRDYVLLHELCHLRHHDHGAGFHALLEKICRDRMQTAHYGYAPDEKLREDILGFASRSRAEFPVSHLLEKAIRTYRIS